MEYVANEENVSSPQPDAEEVLVITPITRKKTLSNNAEAQNLSNEILIEMEKDSPKKVDFDKFHELSICEESDQEDITSSPHTTPLAQRELLIRRINNIDVLMNPTKLIREHLEEIQMRITGHTMTFMYYEKLDKLLGYPISILCSLLSSSIMFDFNSENGKNRTFKAVSLGLSLTSFILSITRDHLDYSKKAQSHDLSSKLYTNLLRSIEVRLIKEKITKIDKRLIFKDIVDQMSIIEQYEMSLPESIEKKIR